MDGLDLCPKCGKLIEVGSGKHLFGDKWCGSVKKLSSPPPAVPRMPPEEWLKDIK